MTTYSHTDHRISWHSIISMYSRPFDSSQGCEVHEVQLLLIEPSSYFELVGVVRERCLVDL